MAITVKEVSEKTVKLKEDIETLIKNYVDETDCVPNIAINYIDNPTNDGKNNLLVSADITAIIK